MPDAPDKEARMVDATRESTRALLDVAAVAVALADEAFDVNPGFNGDHVEVPVAAMEELREAVKVWREASADQLDTVDARDVVMEAPDVPEVVARAYYRAYAALAP